MHLWNAELCYAIMSWGMSGKKMSRIGHELDLNLWLKGEVLSTYDQD